LSFIILKYLITAFIIVIVSEIAKYNDKIGALISSLPIVTILIMIWLYFENNETNKISQHSLLTFWYVIPTLPMFLLMPYTLSKGIGFWQSLLISIVCTFTCFIIIVFLTKKFGIKILP
tara:strand:- start:19 stop:375 length:357 start_codon:yes stop_codon:yes gene_type:complete